MWYAQGASSSFYDQSFLGAAHVFSNICSSCLFETSTWHTCAGHIMSTHYVSHYTFPIHLLNTCCRSAPPTTDQDSHNKSIIFQKVNHNVGIINYTRNHFNPLSIIIDINQNVLIIIVWRKWPIKFIPQQLKGYTSRIPFYGISPLLETLLVFWHWG